jgi:uncharacterized protein
MRHWNFRSADAENSTPSPQQHDRLALGVERIGLIPLRFPLVALVFVIVLAVAAGFGIDRLRVDDSLSQLFRSNTPEFKQFEEVTRRFPSSEFDILMVVEGKALLERDNLQKVRDTLADLQLTDGVKGVISLFSSRQAPKNGQKPGPLFPGVLPTGADYDKLIDEVKSNEIIRGKLLSDDGQLALVVIALNPDMASSSKVGEVIGKIRQAIGQDMAGSGLTAELSGIPVMQLEIRKAVEQDRLVYNGIGFVAGCLIAITFFRRVSFMIIAAGPPLIAILLALGALGWFDFRLNMFLNVMTPLIMVISFSDSMQLTFAARDRLIAGEGKFQAFRNAVLVVGPACVLTHATAGLSFVALLFSSSDLIRTFGEAGIISTAIALLAVLMILPVLGVLLVHKEHTFAAQAKGSDAAVDALRWFCGWIAARMVNRPGLYSLISLTVVIALAVVYAGLEPRYRLADQVPDKQQAVAASHQIDAKLTGSNPVDVLIEFPQGASLYAPETLDVIGQVHAITEKQAGVGNVWSLETLRRWLIEKAGISDVAVLKQYADSIPEHLRRRFIAASQDAVVVSGRIPDVDASKLLPVVDDLDKSLNAIRQAHPGYKVAVTGLAAIAARNSANMIGRLNQALTVEIVFVAAFIGLAFRSFVVMLAAILPGIFPILVSGDVLWLTGNGLQFASIIALTVSFGLGLSATIHFLNRLRQEDNPLHDPAVAVERATVLVGPALILTSVVLACGLAVTAFSNLPSLRLFGWLSAFAMISALVADLLILRPTISWMRRVAWKMKG